MKKYFIFAASALALASCSSDDFLGENPGNLQNATSAINFGGEAGKITRGTSNEGTPQQMLDYQFKIYGVKKMSKNGADKFEPSFTDYSVWYDEAKNTTSNTNGWEYVGNKKAGNEDATYGSGNVKLQNDQYIKYWDYAAEEYRFVAGSPINAFRYNKDLENISTIGTVIKSATVTGLAGHIKANEAGPAIVTNPVYVAEPKIVKKEDYKNPVQFNFIRQQAMVRVGIYENIPGYSITEIKFYKEGETTATSNNVILTSATADYFVGGSDVKGTINYDWTTPSYTYKYDDTGLTKSQNWYAGYFTPHNALATTSSETDVATLYGTDKDMNNTGYFTVLPTPSTTDAKAIVITCDYTLTADDHHGETIEVKGATAAIPAAYSKWEANTRYTYLFKISDNTNGTTGTPGSTDPAGLYPITFDAVVKGSTDAQYGTTTTVATPSITTYQEGSVVGNTIEYKTGKPIYATVANETDGTLKDLKINSTEVGNVQVYKLSKERTEADLQVKAIVSDEIKDANKVTSTEVPATVFGNFEANKYLKFTPEAEGYYAIQYLTTAAVGSTPAAYTYKVVYVK